MNAGALTKEDLFRAMAAIQEQRWAPHPCQLGRHLVSGRALKTPGTPTRCATCGALVRT